MQISRSRVVPQPGLVFCGTALTFGRRGGLVNWILVSIMAQGLLVQGLSWSIPDEWGVTKRHVWENGAVFFSFLWCWLLRWLPSWLKYSYSCNNWSKRKSILIPLQHLTDVTVPKQQIEISDPSQSLTLALTGWEWCLVGSWYQCDYPCCYRIDGTMDSCWPT